jgi:hypothetical protein
VDRALALKRTSGPAPPRKRGYASADILLSNSLTMICGWFSLAMARVHPMLLCFISLNVSSNDRLMHKNKKKWLTVLEEQD